MRARGPIPLPLQLAPLRLRLMSLVYEAMLLFGILFVSSYAFLSIAREAQSGWPRAFFQVYLLCVCGAYFVFCWTRTGQTLALKTWRMRIIRKDGQPLSLSRALWRYLLSIPGMLSGISLLWAAFDKDRQFLHDRLAVTRIVRTDTSGSSFMQDDQEKPSAK
jgi:uncharacterized RDD family membrane protein YckC